MKIFFYVIIFTLLFFNAFSQEKKAKESFGDRVVIGSNVFYFFDDNNTKWKYFYQEIVWNKNIALSLNKHWLIGVNHFDIWSQGAWKNEPVNHRQKYTMFGTFAQYHRLFGREAVKKYKDTHFFAENSFHYGNYCSCGSGLMYKKVGLFYWGLGMGLDISFSKHFSFEFGFHNYQIINKVEKKYNSTQLILGVNYTWDRKSKIH